MKMFTVRPFIVKPFIVNDVNRSKWNMYIWGIICFLLALTPFVSWWKGGHYESYPVFMALVFLGCLYIHVARLFRDTSKVQEVLVKRLDEQSERIRTLEAQLASLTKPSPAH